MYEPLQIDSSCLPWMADKLDCGPFSAISGPQIDLWATDGPQIPLVVPSR